MADNKLLIELESKLAGDFGSAFKTAKSEISGLTKGLNSTEASTKAATRAFGDVNTKIEKVKKAPAVFPLGFLVLKR